jgi:hypothetical protein
VGVAAQKKLKIGVRRLPVDFRRMRKQNGKLIMRDSGRCILDIVSPVVMSIVDASEMKTLTVKSDRLRFVKQHPYTHLFQSRDHTDRIVIPQHAIYRLPETGANQGHTIERCVKGAKGLPPVVARENADVIPDLGEHLSQSPYGARIQVCVQVADVKDRKSVKCGGNVFPLDVVVTHLDPFYILIPSPIQTGQLENSAKTPLQRIPVLRVKKVEALAEDLGLMIAFDSQPLPRMHPPEAFFEPRTDVLLRQ